MAMIQLEPELLLAAYSKGFFPMPDPENEDRIAWYNPDPRAILPLDGFHCSRSFKRFLEKNPFRVSFDRDFDGVIRGCAARDETWITEDIIRAYTRLFRIGAAHSVEVWMDDELAGGLYGVAMGGAFFAESKFHRRTNASKIALFFLTNHLRNRQFDLLEVQFLTEHLASLGAITIPAKQYLRMLEVAIRKNVRFQGP